ncbi:MAG: YidC/Oxa1 family membrane protein insertase [Clostridia bacterium]|nr:YidC/Oxa1 family membrane protein insertase [Clostridia bacterium]
MEFLLNLIGVPLQYVLQFFNSIFNNYTLSIFVFTLIVNVALFPLNVKQQKSMVKQAKLKPKLDALKEKYGDDRMKYSTAMSELYQKEGISPTGGCLPMLIRMPILIGVYQAVRNLVAAGNSNFDFFGIDLAQTPKFSTNIIEDFQLIWIIPLISFGTSFLSMLISNAQQKKNNPQMEQAGGSMKMMLLFMPIMSLWISFTVPGAVGLYWACSNIVTTIIQAIVNKFYSVDTLIAIETAKEGSKRRKFELEKIKKSSDQ